MTAADRADAETSAEREKAPHSQTLSRGIRVLEVLAEADGPLTIAELAAALGVHRSIVYRLLRTLEDHGLVGRTAAGSIELGARLAALARSVSRDLQSAALPELTAVANELGMTAFVGILDHGEVVTLVSVEPRHAHATVAQRPGTRHSLAVGAPGVAIQTLLTREQRRRALPADVRPDLGDDRITEAHEQGYAVSRDEVIPGMSSVAVPLAVPGQPLAALAVVYIGLTTRPDEIGARLAQAARGIRAELS